MHLVKSSSRKLSSEQRRNIMKAAIARFCKTLFVFITIIALATPTPVLAQDTTPTAEPAATEVVSTTDVPAETATQSATEAQAPTDVPVETATESATEMSTQ
jgi:hypothetical protein